MSKTMRAAVALVASACVAPAGAGSGDVMQEHGDLLRMVYETAGVHAAAAVAEALAPLPAACPPGQIMATDVCFCEVYDGQVVGQYCLTVASSVVNATWSAVMDRSLQEGPLDCESQIANEDWVLRFHCAGGTTNMTRGNTRCVPFGELDTLVLPACLAPHDDGTWTHTCQPDPFSVQCYW